MATSTEMKEVNSEFHRSEQQQLPLTVQPKKQAEEENAAPPAQPPLGYKPTQTTCPKCNQQVTTYLTYHITDFTHLSVFLCSIATWPCFMCFVSGIPYCIKHCQKVDHQCPHCNTVIGTHAQFRLSKIFKTKK